LPNPWSAWEKTCFLFIVIVLLGCASQEMMRVRQMDIEDVDIHNVRDGEYFGAFAYSGFEYEVKTTVYAHKIVDIHILQNRDTKHAQRAEGVVSEILKKPNSQR
jgi:uncharacterized protein with FMN-binding domain